MEFMYVCMYVRTHARIRSIIISSHHLSNGSAHTIPLNHKYLQIG
jgi:hypothetical protein